MAGSSWLVDRRARLQAARTRQHDCGAVAEKTGSQTTGYPLAPSAGCGTQRPRRRMVTTMTPHREKTQSANGATEGLQKWGSWLRGTLTASLSAQPSACAALWCHSCEYVAWTYAWPRGGECRECYATTRGRTQRRGGKDLASSTSTISEEIESLQSIARLSPGG